MTDLATHPTAQASAWLADFTTVLERGDVDAAVALFEPDCYWRDLVAFTWNISTQEGPDAIRAMLQARLADVQPAAFAIDGDASEAGGVVEAWFTFETKVARGRGHLRLRGGKAWTLLTTMTELKGHEERKGERRIKGAEHGVHPGRKTWADARADEAATLGFTEQPYVVIVGGGQGGIALGARLRRSASARSSSSATPSPATPGASATRACACTTRSGTTTCRTCLSPTTGRCSRRRTRSATGSRCTPR